jgi:hypothetical protein
MTLPTGNKKRFLEVEDRAGGFSITADAQHADELAILFTQRGITCRKEDAGLGKQTLVFDSEAERKVAEEVLESYVQTKGS